ncbi:PREDICTED: G-type lectin S-receptor-like serine/threonine-protein kinase SD2-5 [Nicotiana attenuata]|uniref:Receptor-like serine/threonine-protein kinase n=1 Tax=Nicotiana attenuata TaxID=49451 RepID=A0A314L5M3_NICAT|nr:PREDICTED: G-type lectin S-receptor-like serine/threonine-protein kinase SD2-5 [Nicotiana attenuata]OIT36407.1 g-type lectin s-receptor-like serinethreonine-protein kinase sd2-5 [Nicotiana attenuata]
MIAEERQYFAILLFIYLLFCLSEFAISQSSWNINSSRSNSTVGLSSLWINRPSLLINSTTDDFYGLTPILLRGNAGPRFLCGFYCNYNATECFLGILLFHNRSDRQNDMVNFPQLVWSANRNHPVKANATLQLGRDGNLVLADSDGTLVWSTNTTGKSVSGLNLTETGNLVLFDKRKHAIWQSFDHPTDSLLPGQSLVRGQKLIASISASNRSQGLLSLTILNGSWATYADTNPPQYYYTSFYPLTPYLSFDGETLTALQDPSTSTTQFMKLGPDGHLRVYQWDRIDWKEVSDILMSEVKNCEYPMVCGRYSICTNNGQCTCPPEESLFRPLSDRKPDLGCSKLTEVNCDSSRYHSFVELKDTVYFAFKFSHELSSGVLWLEGKKLEECKRACLSNCSCKAAVFENNWDSNHIGSCLLLNEVLSLIDNEGGRGKTIFLKVQNSSKALNQSPIILEGKKSRRFKVIIGSIVAALFGIILSISTCFALFKKRTNKSRKAGYLLDLEPILPGMLTRFSYNDLKITTEDFSKKLGEGGFGTVYEGTLSNGTKIAVKHLDGLGQVKESFLTEVNIVGGIHHVNLVKLIGFCAEKSHRLLIYEYMINGSLDRWISHENGLTWLTRQKIISDIAKGLAYLHEDCSQKIIHLDIKPQNILLDQHLNAKISDFGLSKLIEKDKSKVVTRMRGTPGYLAPEWLSSIITEKVDVYAFGIVLLELLCGRKNLDRSQADEEDVHLVSVFRRKAEQEQLMDMVDKNNEDMQLHKEEVTEMMSIAAWCLQGDYTKRPSMTLVVKALEGLVSVESNLDYNFTNVPQFGAGNQQREATISTKLASVLSGPR